MTSQSEIRPYMRNYFDQSDALVFVVDSTDEMRFEECKEVLKKLLSEALLANIPLLLFANK